MGHNVKVGQAPPFWAIIRRMFPNASLEKQIFAFGDTIYAPTELPPDLVAHEETHLKQMHYSYFFAIVWWIRYWWSDKFRAQMEAYACRVQWNKANEMTDDPIKLVRLLDNLCNNLSSEVYNNCTTYNEAKHAILGTPCIERMNKGEKWEDLEKSVILFQ